MQGTYVEPPPPAVTCGSDTCKVFIDGVDFVDIKGVKEATNTGFVGEGYANVDNEKGSYVTYGVTAEKEGKYTFYISFANGGGSARGYSVTAGDKTLIEDGSMESTGGWTTWKTQKVELELPAGYSELKFTSLSNDGMANIDYIGWMSENLLAGKVDVGDTSTTPGDSGTTAISVRDVRAANPARTADRYFVDFGTHGNNAGVYLRRGARTFRVNGSSHSGAQR